MKPSGPREVDLGRAKTIDLIYSLEKGAIRESTKCVGTKFLGWILKEKASEEGGVKGFFNMLYYIISNFMLGGEVPMWGGNPFYKIAIFSRPDFGIHEIKFIFTHRETFKFCPLDHPGGPTLLKIRNLVFNLFELEIKSGI